MMRPTTRLASTSPAIIGSDIRPATVGLLPREIWKYWLRNTVPANSVTPTNRLAKVARAVLRSRNSRSGMIGSAARASRQTARASSRTPPPTIRAVAGEPQANWCPASDTQMSSVLTPPTMRVAPR